MGTISALLQPEGVLLHVPEAARLSGADFGHAQATTGKESFPDEPIIVEASRITLKPLPGTSPGRHNGPIT